MPKKVKELSAAEVRRLNNPGKYSVGGISGLVLYVKPSGARSWVYQPMIAGRRHYIGLGGFPDVSLAQARELARRMKEKILLGEDPIQDRRAHRIKRFTFTEAAEACHKKKLPEFKSEKHGQDWINSLKRYVCPQIGKIPVNEIGLDHVLSVLQPIWENRTETATRIRQRMEAVLAWATVSGHRSGDNPARWQGNLDAVLPAPGKIRKVKHYRALPWREMGKFMQDLRTRHGGAARALEFLVLTAARSGEIRFATWSEIDLENKTWTVPAERMKAGREHAVPLSDQALEVLKNVPRFEGVDYIFVAPRGGPLSDMAISAVCKRMKIDAVPHGFRSTFRDWCAESTNFPREVAEMALAHTIENRVEAAYRRGDLLEKRRQMMQAWADYCDKVQDGEAKVTPIREEVANG